jgi:putative selenium metabolism protein SsnA
MDTTSTTGTNDVVLLRGATLADLSPPRLRAADVWIGDGVIIAVGDAPADVRASTTIECSGCLVLPGLVCGHGHLYSALATGMPGPAVAPTCFVEILERVWWRLDEALDEPSLRASAFVGALGAVRNGTTAIIDHHASPSLIDGSLDVIADALEEVGLRGVLCYETTDRGGPGRRDAGLRENERFLEASASRRLARGLVGGHAGFTLSDESLAACVDIARRHGSGLHVHVAEDGADQRDSVEKHGHRVLERLSRAGALGPRTLLAHGVHLDERERALLAGSECWIAHNPRSNMNNSVGYARPSSLGPRVVLGTDGIGADMIAESQHAFFRAREESLHADAATIVGWLARGAELVSDLFGLPVGRLEPGAAADITVLEPGSATPITEGSLPWHWMFAFSSRQVRDVLVGGRVVLRDREVVSVDEERVLALAREEAPRLWARM